MVPAQGYDEGWNVPFGGLVAQTLP